jgi:hypothetical protein
MGQQDAVLLAKLQPLAENLVECHDVGHREFELANCLALVVVDADQEGVKLAVLCHVNLLAQLSSFR